VDSGFKRTAITILDANLTTLIAAAVLMQFGTGPIEGFAITLSIGVITSVYTALIIGRALFDLSMSRHYLKKVSMLSIFRQTPRIPFMQTRYFAFAFSAFVILIGMVMFAFRGMDNFGVDFQQGTNLMLHISNPEPVPVGSVREVLTSGGFNNPVVQETTSETGVEGNTFIIRVSDVTRQELQAPGAVGEAAFQTVADRIRTALAPLSAGGSIDDILLEDEQTVGPSVGAQLRWDALNAVFWALVFIIIYMWIRFDIRYAIGGVVALFHDCLVALGLFSLMGGYISMNVIAAILTVLGYSINDTIVVFDRVREDMQLQRGKGVKFMDILNGAINATLSRTLLTSLTTLFVVVVLALFGGSAINDFALVLLIGIVFGTYSSIFIASALVYLMQGKKEATPAARTRRTSKETGNEVTEPANNRRAGRSAAKA